jgi:hypothetical protein
MKPEPEDTLEIRKGIKNNKLVHVFSVQNVGKIFVPTSLPESLLPYLEIVERERTKK